jgi:hypothetical protein
MRNLALNSNLNSAGNDCAANLLAGIGMNNTDATGIIAIGSDLGLSAGDAGCDRLGCDLLRL